MTSTRRATDPGTGLWNGVHYLVDCADGCGSTVVVTQEYVGRDVRCASHGREYRGAPVPQRPQPGETRYNGLRIGQPGESMPGHLDPDRLTRVAEVKPAAPILPNRGLVEEWPVDDPRLPARVVRFIAEVPGTRVCHTISSSGETIGVHLPQRLAAMFERREARGKVDLKRTPKGRVRVQRYGPDGNVPPRVDWPSYVLMRAGHGLVKVTVTAAIQILRQRAET